MNAVVWAGIDLDGAQARSGPDGRDAGAVVDDADRLGDDHRAIAVGVVHVDLAAGGGLAERKGKSPARRGERAGATVRAMSRNPSPVWSRLRRRGGEAESEKSPGDGWQRYVPDHGMPSKQRGRVAGAAYTAGQRCTRTRPLYLGRTVDPIKKL